MRSDCPSWQRPPEPARVPPPPEGNDSRLPDDLGESTDALTAQGVEKLIPLRFVQMLPCDPAQPTCADNAAWDWLMLAVQRANQVYRAAGIQFWIRAMDRYEMPTFAISTELSYELAWTAVRTELRRAFPAISDTDYSNANKWKADWLRSVAALYAPASEITVWVKQGGNTGHQTWLPEHGRSMQMSGPNLDPVNGWPFIFGHELGHYFGLAHSWEYNYDDSDPITLQPWLKSDSWDLVYKPGTSAGNPHVFFNSKGEAAQHELDLQLIQKAPCKVHCAGFASNCKGLSPPCTEADCLACVNCGTCACGCGCGCGITECDSCIDGGAGLLTCHIGESSAYSENAVNGDARLKGLAFTFAGGAMGPNVMSYRGDFRTHPYGLSDSQVQMIRKHLRWDSPLRSGPQASIYGGWQGTQVTLSGQRPRLGSWSHRRPADKLDFDADGKRDIAIWVPPTTLGGTGTFRVWLSTTGFAYYWDKALGGLGDTPVPANYGDESGDVPRTDIAVFQPGGGYYRDSPQDTNGWWRWCRTDSDALGCTMGTTLLYGQRYDVPQPGLDFDGVPPDDLSVYRPSTAAWWWYSAGTGTQVRQISGANSGAVPIAGLYDCDDLADLAVYEPYAAKIQLLRSQLSWSESQKITRDLDTKFIASPSGTSTARSGAFPVHGMQTLRLCCWGRTCYQLPRLHAALWFPEDGTWNFLSPVENNLVTSCSFGNGTVMPVPGADRSGDWRSDMAYYVSPSAGQGWLYFKNFVPTLYDCSGTQHNPTSIPNAGGARVRVYGVSDMTGDGLPEILVIDPQMATIRWLTSESGYSSVGGSVSHSDSSMEVL